MYVWFLKGENKSKSRVEDDFAIQYGGLIILGFFFDQV
jgi:hypothetical protein